MLFLQAEFSPGPERWQFVYPGRQAQGGPDGKEGRVCVCVCVSQVLCVSFHLMTTLFGLICRNCRSPSQSWFSQLPAGALMVFSIQVRERRMQKNIRPTLLSCVRQKVVRKTMTNMPSTLNI